jgi:hypothetical protein
MGENCNSFNNRIRGNAKIEKTLDIKEGLDVNCLMYCKHCINFRHKGNKNDLKQMFQRKLACTAVLAHNVHEPNMQEWYRKVAQVPSASGGQLDT